MLEKPLMVFGEVLWDIFPDGKKLGGAALNFSYYFKKAGGNPIIISSVGRDSLGYEMLNKIENLGLDNSFISQVNRPTGRVNLSLERGGHGFEILRDMAWENISYPSDELIKNSFGIYFGTVARISQRNRDTLDRLIKDFEEGLIFLDLNLRDGFYDVNDINTLLTKANYLKLNYEEATKLKEFGIINKFGEEEIVSSLIKNHKLNACVITLGEKGAVGGNEKDIFRVYGIPARADGDAVGCGDAFAAIWLASLLKGMNQEESLCQANEIASKVASKRGAIIEI